MNEKIYRCGFCGEIIDGISLPVAITFETGPDEYQNLYCHQGCLKKALHPSVFTDKKD